MIRTNRSDVHFHVLDAGSIWVKEFASALSKLTPTTAWVPSISKVGYWQKWERTEQIDEPAIEITRFPLQQGYARTPVARLLPFERKLFERLKARSRRVSDSTLVCTSPFYAPVAEQWSGPVVYYVTDLTKKYESCDEKQVTALDGRLCKVAAIVCPNSRRIADYLIHEAGCPVRKIVTLPNATRRSNIPSHVLTNPSPLPVRIAHLRRPVAGVVGNLAANMDWILLREVISQTPALSWVFVGPTTMPVRDALQSAARRWVMRNACFTGAKPYGELQSFARSFDVAVLPYRKAEPTYSGSFTRFYEHLAASRPMIGTRGFAELLEKEPLITLVDSAPQLIAALLRLQENGFHDGHEHGRWLASQTATWEERARTMVAALQREPIYS